MNSKLQILWTIMAAVSCSFLQTPSNQFHSTFNSTFLTENERLFKPIFIPNITNNSGYLQKTKTRVPHETHKTNENEVVLKKILQPQEISQESTIRENYSEEIKTAGNPLKFSSRYSTKDEDPSKEVKKNEKLAEVEDPSRRTDTSDLLEKTEIKMILSKNEEIPIEKRKTFSNRSDDLNDSEEEATDPDRSSDSDEEKDEEIPPATDETYPELPKSNSFRKYSDFENYETTSTSIEDTENSEETDKEEEENKRSVDDYYNSGSKNYHSIQTPLKEIKYRGPHSYKDDFESEKVRTRFSPIRGRPITHNRPQVKSELEKLNEISESDENYEKTLDEGVKEEVKIKPKQKDLELAVEKDEFKFDRNKKYNFIEERKRRKQQQKNLAAEENKDDRTPLFHSLQQYQVDEKEPHYQSEVKVEEKPISRFNYDEESRTTRRPPKNIFNVRTPKRKPPKKFNISDELSHNFQGHQFLGPIVFNHNLQEETVKTNTKSQKEPVRNIFLEGLSENEKVDQNNLSSRKFQKSIFGTGSLEIKSFNHLEESDEMYNAILANIQSVFGLKAHLGKSGSASQKGSIPKVNSDETKSLTWSSSPTKREKVN